MDHDLFAHDIGEGLCILIIHGWEMNGKVEELDFEPIFSQTPGLRRIYVDLPGMGHTPANGIKSLEDIYQRLVRFVDARLGSLRFLLAGSSCGGYLARALALKYREQVDGLLLRVPLIEPVNSNRDLDPFKPIVANEQILADKDTAMVANILVQTASYMKSMKAKFEAVYLPAMTRANHDAIDPIRADPQRYSLSLSLDDKGVQLLAPTLVICGRHDSIVGYRDALRLLDFYPRSTFAVLDRGEHWLPLDETELFNALVKDWMTRVHEWRSSMDSREFHVKDALQ